jgi:MFS family permease
MKKALIALVAIATIAVAMIGDAEAQRRRGPSGAAIGLGVLGGIAAGAIIGGAIATSRPGYAYPAYGIVPGYVAYDGYYVAAPIGCPGGYWARRPRYDQWGNMVGYSKPRFFCP